MSSAPATKPSRKRNKAKAGAAASPAPEPSQEKPATQSANGSQKGGEKGEKEYVRLIFKQIKKHTKKLESIAKSEEKIKDLTEEERAKTTIIDQDERVKITNKPGTLAVQKELKELYETLQKIAESEDKRAAAERAEAEAKLASAVEEARAGAMKEIDEAARAKILTVVKFLRLAGHRRTAKSEDEDEDDAIEKVLVLVYGGEQTAVDACLKLAEGSEDPVEGSNVPYARIKQVAHELKVLGVDEDEIEETIEPAGEQGPEQALEQEPERGQQTEDPPAYNPENTEPDYTAVQDEKASVYVEDAAGGLQTDLQQSYANGQQIEATVGALDVSVAGENAANQASNDFGPESLQGSQILAGGAPIQEFNEQNTAVGTEEPAIAVEEANSAINGATAGESWADDQPNPSETVDEFQNVERRRGGLGYHGRARGEYRGRGYRERGERGDRSGRGGRGGRGGSGYRGYYRGGGDGDGGRGHHHHHPRGGGDGDRDGHYFRPRGNSRQQQPQQPAAAP